MKPPSHGPMDITKAIVRHETLMGFSTKPSRGSLVHILQQTQESRAIYHQVLSGYDVVFLTELDIIHLANMLASTLIITNGVNNTITRAEPRTHCHDNMVIHIKLDAHNVKDIHTAKIPIMCLSSPHGLTTARFSAEVMQHTPMTKTPTVTIDLSDSPKSSFTRNRYFTSDYVVAIVIACI